MKERDVHFRHILLYYFRKGKNASQAQKKLCSVYGDEALKERQCRNWFERFRSGDFSLKNSQRSGRPVEVDETHIKAIIDTNHITEKLNVSHTWCCSGEAYKFHSLFLLNPPPTHSYWIILRFTTFLIIFSREP
ncbi:unnamed protein product [Rodentolepis nana]|uniref:HTH_48 domain-containing protein n=1 Tax=Rodentolepis nana TaxID=102285 RepID=A0A0R3TSN0_RODNA|nr:unnamed protein product [Rodentolepis nana]